MSGDSQSNDEPDFLDDFVVEDIAGKNDDLDQLFEDPAAGGAAKKPTPKPGVPDSEDLLFKDHTDGLNPSENFEGKGSFAEDNASEWTGEQLELDDDAPKARGKSEVEAAEDAFTEELGSLLQNDDELGIDDKELELVDGPSASAADGISEIEQSGPFVIDEGEGEWQDQVAAAATTPAGVQREVAEGIWEAVKDPAMAEVAGDEANEATEEPGWEPLPEASVDELSEVGEVEERDDAAAVPAPAELAAHEGQDIYADDQAPVLVGPRAGRLRRASGLVAALAASLAVVGLGAVVVMRPEWVGLHLEPAKVQQVQIERPRIALAVAPPPVVPVVAPQLGKHDPKQPEVGTPKGTPGGETTPPQPKDPVAVVLPTPGEQYGPPLPPTLPSDPAPTPVGIPVAVVADPAPTAAWPVASTPVDPTRLAPKKPGVLVRIGDDTMVGEVDPAKAPKVQAVEGVLPGTRAFAQLHNGNYFIGSIKVVAADRVTLRINEGEVTLAADEISRITALGSADYEALQKATSGFVRLTNNNKLVGGILSQIADDHIVLEFRSNRVILPRSAVGAVVQGEPEQEVRLEVTREEDDWVKSLVERQLGGTTPTSAPTKGPLLITPPPPESKAPSTGAANPKAQAAPAKPAARPAPAKPAAKPAAPAKKA